jgi:response regulator RpfG family c-di-GMP phosphodiesterase
MESVQKCILFIDDSAPIRKYFSDYLNEIGFKVILAKDGKEGVNLFKTNNVDIVITDLYMPVMTGHDVQVEIKKISSETPIIIISGKGEMKDVIRALRYGAWDYLTKPIENKNILKFTLNRIVEKLDLIRKNIEYEKRLEYLVDQRTSELEKTKVDLQDTLDDIIKTLSAITRVADPYAKVHQENVANISIKIGYELSLKKDHIIALRISGLLHDIGKIFLPRDFLLKPGELTDYEFKIIREHPQAGYDLLKNISFPWPIKDIVLQHHERLDGSGYPSGLKEKEILIESKIIGIADVVEAMSSHRHYRPAIGLGKALEEIKINKGVLYDADCTDACLKIFKNKNNMEMFSVLNS